MYERRNRDRLGISFKTSLHALVLPERMQLADKASAASDQHAGSFGKDKAKIADVFEYQIAGDQIDRGLRDGPSLSDIGEREGYIFAGALLLSLLDHRCRKIDGLYLCGDFAQPASVLSGAAANFENRFAVTILQSRSGDLLVKVAREISIFIISSRPKLVSCIDFHFIAAIPANQARSKHWDGRLLPGE